jgi:hypothetical protein
MKTSRDGDEDGESDTNGPSKQLVGAEREEALRLIMLRCNIDFRHDPARQARLHRSAQADVDAYLQSSDLGGN